MNIEKVFKEKEEYKNKANQEINAKFETEEKKIRDEIVERDKKVAELDAKGCKCKYDFSENNPLLDYFFEYFQLEICDLW